MAASSQVDLEHEVLEWAKTMFQVVKTKEQAKVNPDALQYNINWKWLKIKHSEPQYQDVDKPSTPKSQVLFRTFFSNNTDQEQEYSFKTERTTNSCCEIEIEKGVTYGQEMSISLKTPCEVFEASAGFSRELELRSCNTETIEEELIWAVDSQIKVPPRHKTTAELVISEDAYTSQFKVNTQVSGKVIVTITNLNDNNSLIKVLENKIDNIITQALQKGLTGVSVNKSLVKFTTEGKCSFRYAVEQHVKLSEEKL